MEMLNDKGNAMLKDYSKNALIATLALVAGCEYNARSNVEAQRDELRELLKNITVIPVIPVPVNQESWEVAPPPPDESIAPGRFPSNTTF